MLDQQFRTALFEEILDEIRDHLKRRIAAEKQQWLWGFQWYGTRAFKQKLSRFEENVTTYRAQFLAQRDIKSLDGSLNGYLSNDVPVVVVRQSYQSVAPLPQVQSSLIYAYLFAANKENPVQAVNDVQASIDLPIVVRCRTLCNMTRDVEAATLQNNVQKTTGSSMREKIRTEIAKLYPGNLSATSSDEDICAQVPWMLRTPSERQTVRELLAIANKNPVSNDDKINALNCLDRLSHFRKSNINSFNYMKALFKKASYFPSQQPVVADVTIAPPDRAVVRVAPIPVSAPAVGRAPGENIRFFQAANNKTIRACAEQSCDYIFDMIRQIQPDFQWKGPDKDRLMKKFIENLEVYGEPTTIDQAHVMVMINILNYCDTGCDLNFVSKQFVSADKKIIGNLRCGLKNYFDDGLRSAYDSNIENTLTSDHSCVRKLQEIMSGLFPNGMHMYLKTDSELTSDCSC